MKLVIASSFPELFKIIEAFQALAVKWGPLGPISLVILGQEDLYR